MKYLLYIPDNWTSRFIESKDVILIYYFKQHIVSESIVMMTFDTNLDNKILDRVYLINDEIFISINEF